MAAKYTVQDFFKQFPDDDTCLDYLMNLRFGESLDCPKCGKHGRFTKITKQPAYQCAWCGNHIHPMVGTPFEKSRTPLQKWFYAMYLFTVTRSGVSAKELQRQLGVTYKTAWRMGHEIRKYMGKVDGDSGLSGHVEIDEAYIGGKEKGLRGRPTSKSSKKVGVLGMVQRNGDIITRVIDDVKWKTILPHITKFVAVGTIVSTDEMMSYRILPNLGYHHGRVHHHAKEWKNGIHHTNTIEGFWSHFKNAVRGTHKSVSRQHMQNYLHEFEFRFNLRKDVSGSMFDRLIQAF